MGAHTRCLVAGSRKPGRTGRAVAVTPSACQRGQEQGTQWTELGGGWSLGKREEWSVLKTSKE